MKESIEELIKKSLEGHEMSYRPEAWDTMRARLDVVSPVAAPRSYFKYYMGAAGLGLTAVAAYFIFTYDAGTKDVPQTQIVQNETSSESTSSESTVSTENNSTVDNSTTGSTATTNTSDNSSTSSTSNTSITPDPSLLILNGPNGTNGGPTNNGGQNVPIPNVNGNTPNPNVQIANTNPGNNNPTAVKQMIVPVIPDLCMNERIKVENVNDRMIIILAPDGTFTAVQAGKVFNYQAKMEGMHGIGFMENEDFYSESTFNVQGAPDSEFSMDHINKFSSGVPTTHVVANTNGNTYTWKTKTEITTGTEANLHFYKRGNQTISLTVSNNVCSATTEKSIYIDEDYLLMAVNSFDPRDNDPRNTTFMPFALTQRDVNFNLVIIDSRDGGIVYETSQSDLPWDGIDMRTGKQERGITTYIWKVILYNPDHNEPGEYIGTITKL